MGYGGCEKGYRVYITHSNKVVLSRSVVFDEDSTFTWEIGNEKLTSPLLMFEDREEDTQNERVQVDTGESSQESLISQGEAETNEEVCSDSEAKVTPMKIRTLANIYAR